MEQDHKYPSQRNREGRKGKMNDKMEEIEKYKDDSNRMFQVIRQL